MNKSGFLKEGQCLHGGWRWSDSRSDFNIYFDVDLTDTKMRCITLFHRTFKQRILLDATQLHYGGFRYWFICPDTGIKVTKLYFCKKHNRFVSRHICGLLYASQSETTYSRILNKMKKIEIKMGGISPHKKIKGMQRRTHQSLYEIWALLEDQYDAMLFERKSLWHTDGTFVIKK